MLTGHFAVHLALCSIALTQPLLQLYGANIAVFVAADMQGWPVLWFAVAWALVPASLMSLIEMSARIVHVRAGHVVHLAMVTVGAWASWAVALRGVSVGLWVVDLSLSGAFAAMTGVAYARWRTLRSWLSYLAPLAVVVVATFAVSARAVIWPPPVEMVAVQTTVPPTTVPGRPAIDPASVSVVWVVLDEAPLFPLLTTTGEINASRFPGFASLAESSTWYRNALATSQTTTDAVPAMLTGKWPTSGVAPVLAKHPRNLFTLMNGRLAMDAHEVATALCPRKVCATVSVTGGDHVANPSVGTTTAVAASTTVPVVDDTAAPRVDYGAFMRDVWVVVGHKMLPRGLRDRLPAIDEGWGGFGAVDAVSGESDVPGGDAGSGDGTVDDTATDDAAPGSTTTVALTEEQKQKAESTTVREWESGGPMSQVPVLEGVIDRAARADRPTLHFAHVLLPHRPWMLAPDMRRSRAIPTDKRSNEIVDRVRDEYQAHLLQYSATDALVGDLVETLRRSANWDRTLLVVTADHGITFEPGESKRKTIDPTATGTLEDIYRVPMFVKYPGQVSGSVDDCAASGVDLLPTVIAATGIDPGWNLDGADLAGPCPTREERRIIWPDGSATMRSSFPAVVERAVRYDEWVDAEGGVDDIVRAGVHGDLVGTEVPVAATPEVGLEWSLDKPDDFTRVGDGRFGFVPTQVQGTVRARRDFGADEEGLLVVNGRVVGVVSELAGLRRGEETVFRSTLLSRLLPAGSHRVEMWVATGSGPTAMLRRVTL